VCEVSEISVQTDTIVETICNYKDAEIGACEIEDFISFEERLSELINEKGKLYTLVKGQKTLSLHSGMILQNLISTCGTSVKKLPHIIGSVLTLFFGRLEEPFLTKFIKTSTTYDDAMTRSSLALNNFNKSLFVDHQNENNLNDVINEFHVPVFFLCLIVDGSNKKGKQLNAKPIVYFGTDCQVHQMSLHTDLSHSKKHGISSSTTFDNMVMQLSEVGVSRTNGAACDKFAEGELSKVLTLVDSLCNTLWANNVRDTLTFNGNNGAVFIFGIGAFRKYRVWTCFMHAIENMLKPILRSMLQTRGLGKDASIISNMFKIHYYNDKYKHKFNYLNVMSVGGEPERLKELPRIVQKTFREIADTRWISQERQCDELIQFLEVPASQHLIDLVRNDFPHQLEHFDSLMNKCSSFYDNTSPSHYILQFLYIANHAAGGENGEAAENCRDLTAFLQHPFTRIIIKIVKELYDFHMHIAKFANGKSKIPIPVNNAISTRLLEAPIYYRRVFKYFYDLKLDWKSKLDVDNFVTMEINRAEELGVPNFETIQDDINMRMNNGLNECWPNVVKYLQQPFLSRSFSIVLVLVKELSAHWAAGVLEGLEHSEYITITDIERGAFIDSSLHVDVDQLNNHQWTNVDDPYFAYPGMTYAQFREHVRNSFTLEVGRETIAKKDKNSNIEGLVYGYGLICDEIVEELVSIAGGEYLNDERWQSGDAVKNYFVVFKEWYPNLAECLIINFIYMSITSTISEQSFTVATNLTQANTTESTERRNLDFFFNVRAKIVRELLVSDDEESDVELEVDNRIKRGKKRTLDKKSALTSFLQKVCEMTDEVYYYNNVNALKRDLGKKREQIRNSMGDINKELTQNFAGHSKVFGNNEYTNYMEVFSDAYRRNAETLQRPVQQLTQVDKLVTHSSWTAIAVRLFLRKKDIMFTADVEKVTKAVRKRVDPPYPEMKTTYDYLREYLIREQISEDVINNLLALLDNNLLNVEYITNNFVVEEVVA
jgi:hypothetical protein